MRKEEEEYYNSVENTKEEARKKRDKINKKNIDTLRETRKKELEETREER
jgi:hypothetical protein